MTPANISIKLKSLSLLSTFIKSQSFSTKTLIPKDFISKNPFLTTCNNNPDIEKSLNIIFSLNPSPDFVHLILRDCPRVLEYEFLKNWESSFSQVGIWNVGFSAIRNVLEVSRKFGLGPGNVSERLARLKSLGFSHGTVIRVLEGCPMVVVMNENGIREKVEFLERNGFDKDQTDMIFGLVPCTLTYSVENKMRPLFNEFQDLGFARNVVRREILRDPSVLKLELGELSRCLELLSSLKCRVPIREKIFSEGDFRAGIEVKRRVDCLCRYGLIRRDAFKVLWKEPRVILYEVADIEKKIEFLIHKMGFNIICVVDVPEYLGVNFEKQIVARYNVIEYLRSRGGIGDEVTLKGMIKLSRLRFFNLYVKPYPECEKIFGRFAGDVAVKKRHPAGMWKLFVPKQHPSTEADVTNMKSFMDGFAVLREGKAG